MKEAGHRDKPEWLERVGIQFDKLSLKRRLQLIDFLKADAVIESDGARITLHSEYELRRVAKKKAVERPIEDWVRSFRAGEVFYDIGANTGAFSLLAGLAHEGRVPVYAFEPSFSSYEALTRNIIANKLTQSVYPLPIAFYSETGLRQFHYRRLEAGAAKHGVDVPLDAKSREMFEPVVSHPVLTMTLDDFVARFGAPLPVHLKIDIDGHEILVLAGATRALSESVRTLCVEVVQSDQADSRPEALQKHLAASGFELEHVVARQEERYPRGLDYLFRRR